MLKAKKYSIYQLKSKLIKNYNQTNQFKLENKVLKTMEHRTQQMLPKQWQQKVWIYIAHETSKLSLNKITWVLIKLFLLLMISFLIFQWLESKESKRSHLLWFKQKILHLFLNHLYLLLNLQVEYQMLRK